MFRDPQFGPAILFGLGGVFTEALSDVVFRLAPLTRRDAAEMIDAIQSQPLIESFRGQRAVDRQVLEQTLMGLSAIAVDFPEIVEIDINPLIATTSGELLAVDALMSLGRMDDEIKDLPPVPPPAIHMVKASE